MHLLTYLECLIPEARREGGASAPPVHVQGVAGPARAGTQAYCYYHTNNNDNNSNNNNNANSNNIHNNDNNNNNDNNDNNINSNNSRNNTLVYLVRVSVLRSLCQPELNLEKTYVDEASL